MINWEYAVKLWRKGHDTKDIASALSTITGFHAPEAVVYNQLHKYRAMNK